jgi:hypothetical protein
LRGSYASKPPFLPVRSMLTRLDGSLRSADGALLCTSERPPRPSARPALYGGRCARCECGSSSSCRPRSCWRRGSRGRQPVGKSDRLAASSSSCPAAAANSASYHQVHRSTCRYAGGAHPRGHGGRRRMAIPQPSDGRNRRDRGWRRGSSIAGAGRRRSRRPRAALESGSWGTLLVGPALDEPWEPLE